MTLQNDGRGNTGRSGRCCRNTAVFEAAGRCRRRRPRIGREELVYHLTRAILGLVNLPTSSRNSWMHPSIDRIFSVTRSR